MSALNATAGRIGITVGKTSGAQNTICSEKDWSGSAAKTQPPSLAELGAHSGRLRNAVMVPLIVRIATQAFPGKSGYLCIPRVVVTVRRPPIKPRHSRPHLYSEIVSRYFRSAEAVEVPMMHRVMHREDIRCWKKLFPTGCKIVSDYSKLDVPPRSKWRYPCSVIHFARVRWLSNAVLARAGSSSGSI